MPSLSIISKDTSSDSLDFYKFFCLSSIYSTDKGLFASIFLDYFDYFDFVDGIIMLWVRMALFFMLLRDLERLDSLGGFNSALFSSKVCDYHKCLTLLSNVIVLAEGLVSLVILLSTLLVLKETNFDGIPKLTGTVFLVFRLLTISIEARLF